MKRIVNLIGVIALLINIPIYAQTTIVKEYVDKYLQPAKQHEAKYYKIATTDKNNMSVGVVEYYYLTNGSVTKNLYARGEYEKNSRIGKWEWWYASGQPLEVGHFEKKPAFYEEKNSLKSESLHYTYKIESFWDSTGVQMVKNGNGEALYAENGINLGHGKYQNGLKQGEWKGSFQVTFEEDYIQYVETYSAGELVSGTSYDKHQKRLPYSQLEVLPEPEGGINGFMRYLSRSLKYPKIAKKKA